MLRGKVAFITGGSTGIGFATAKLFVEQGAYVYITGRREDKLLEATRQLGNENSSHIQGDVSVMTDLDRIFQTIRENHNVLHIVFANAGLSEFSTLAQATESHFDKIFDVNVKGLFFTVQKSLPLLEDGGAIVLNGSICANTALDQSCVYGGSKAAIRSFGRGFAQDLKGRKIRVNVVSPGIIDTPMFDTLGIPEEVKLQVKQSFTGKIPLGRLGTSEDVAKAVLFLSSSDSSFLTGAELYVDGGMTQI